MWFAKNEMDEFIWCWLTIRLSSEKCTVGWQWWILNNSKTLTQNIFRSSSHCQSEENFSQRGPPAAPCFCERQRRGLPGKFKSTFRYTKGEMKLTNYKNEKGRGFCGTWNLEAQHSFFFISKEQKRGWWVKHWNIPQTFCKDTETVFSGSLNALFNTFFSLYTPDIRFGLHS